MSPIKGAHAFSPVAPPAMVPAKPPSSQRLSAFPARPDPLSDWVKVRKLALRQLNRFMALEPKVLKGDDRKAVHDLRVASRRLQQVLDLLFPAPPKDIRRLRRKIRGARRALSEVRNCDVHLERVERALARRRISHRAVWVMVQEYLGERRSASFHKAVRKLGKANLGGVSRRLKQHLDGRARSARRHLPLQAPTEAAAQDGSSSEIPLREYARLALERAWRDFEPQLTESRRDRQTPGLHGARIAAKRLRYLVEVLGALEYAGSAEVLAALRRMQTHLGSWHDLEVFEQLLVEMVARPKFLAAHLEAAMAAQKLIVRSRRAKKNYVTKYLDLMLGSGEGDRLKAWAENLLGEASPPVQNAG